ncbi:hypothetical protein GE118_03825 [Mycoplasma sp. NEAQ87857]|uniref:MIP family Ig-specific serine endopeptidase n=1 Tax=Mycoplasma sp. NEAQ87857 TaxID=2683967 RepID=UPI00131716C0|nr:hypothetical protein [Mycoplasma sp. NEAQ87857]QGZ97911.1 hypothetical protein GE118_03825 [Mycoplasma sp. NEAQ87857]
MKNLKQKALFLIAANVLSGSLILSSCANNYQITNDLSKDKKNNTITNDQIKIGEIKNDIAKVLIDIQTTKKDLVTIKGEVINQQTKVAEAYKLFEPLQAQYNTLDSEKEKLVNDLKALLSKDSATQVETINQKIKNIEYDIQTINFKITQADNDIESNNNLIQRNKRTKTSNTTAIARLQTEINQLKQKIQTKEASTPLNSSEIIANNRRRINTLNTLIRDLQNQLRNLTSSDSNAITNARDNLAKAKQLKAQLESQITNITETITLNQELFTSIATVKTFIKNFINTTFTSNPEVSSLFDTYVLDWFDTSVNNSSIGVVYNESLNNFIEVVRYFILALFNENTRRQPISGAISSSIQRKRIRNALLTLTSNQQAIINQKTEEIRTFWTNLQTQIEPVKAALAKEIEKLKPIDDVIGSNNSNLGDFDSLLNSKLTEARDQLNQANNIIKQNTRVLDNNDQSDKSARIQALQDEIAQKQQELDQLNQSLQTDNELSSLKNDLAFKERQLESYNQQNTNLDQEIADAEQKITQLTTAKQDLTTQRTSLQQQRTELTNSLRNYNPSTDNTEITNLKNRIKLLNDRFDYQEYNDKNNAYKEVKRELVKLEHKQNIIQNSLNNLDNRLSNLKRQLTDIENQTDSSNSPVNKKNKDQKFPVFPNPIEKPKNDNGLGNGNQPGNTNPGGNNQGDNGNTRENSHPENGNQGGSSNMGSSNQGGGENNRGTNPPQPPVIPPFFNQNYTKQNSYPDYISRYNSKFVSAETIYQEIYDRTFSLQLPTRLNDPTLSNDILSNNQGTGWLLDYHRYTNTNKYKLFIATNLHVLGNFSNANSQQVLNELNYVDPTGNTPAGVALGKTEHTPTSFASIPNLSYSQFINQRGGSVKYYGSEQFFTTDRGFSSTYNSTTYTPNVYTSSPQIVFAAVDYISDKAYNQFKPMIDTLWNTYKQQYPDSEAVEGYNKLTNKKIPFYTDFGVIEFDVDLDHADETFRGWINKAVSAVDNYIARTKQSGLPNTLTGSNFMTLDYLSKGRDLSQTNPEYAFGLSNAKNIYIAGYPRNTDGTTLWMQNNPTERNGNTISYFRPPKNVDAFAYSTNDANSKIEVGNISIYTDVWNRPFVDFYGFNYNIRFSSLFFGASGSVAYNDFGEIVGIYNNTSQSTKFGDLLKSATFAPFLQTANISTPIGTIYAYNLIDGTDKNLFPEQTHSFRDNLRLIYKNGFSDGTRTTALFPQGY